MNTVGERADAFAAVFGTRRGDTEVTRQERKIAESAAVAASKEVENQKRLRTRKMRLEVVNANWSLSDPEGCLLFERLESLTAQGTAVNGARVRTFALDYLRGGAEGKLNVWRVQQLAVCLSSSGGALYPGSSLHLQEALLHFLAKPVDTLAVDADTEQWTRHLRAAAACVITRQAFDFSRYPRSHHLIEPIAEIMREATTSGDFWVAGTASSEQNQKNVFGVTSFMNIGVGSIFRADKLAGAMLKVLRSATSEERATTLRPWCEVLIERMRSGQCTADEEDDLEALFMDTPKFAEQWRQAVGKTVGIYWWRRLSRRRYRRRRLDAFERLLASARTITT